MQTPETTETLLRRMWDDGPIDKDDDDRAHQFDSLLRRYEAEEDLWREIEDGD